MAHSNTSTIARARHGLAIDRSNAGALTAEVVGAESLHPHDVAAWRRMCEANEELCDPFLSPEFAASVASVRPYVYVCVLRRQGEPVAFFPFQFPSRLHKAISAAERVGGEMNDCFGLVANPGFSITTRQLLSFAGVQSLLFSHMPSTQHDYGLTGSGVVESPLIQCGPDYWENLKRTNKRFVNDTNRCKRNLEGAVGPLSFTANEQDFDSGLEELIRLKRRQYQQTGVGDALMCEWTRRLLFALAKTKSPTCTGMLSTLYAGDTWLASHFGLRSGGLLHYWFPIYNRKYATYAPGRLLLVYLIQASEHLKIKTIDQGPGPSVAKQNFSNGTRLFCRGAWYAPGVRSALYRTACSVNWRMKAYLSASSTLVLFSTATFGGASDA